MGPGVVKENLNIDDILIHLFDSSQGDTVISQINAVAGTGPKSSMIFDLIRDGEITVTRNNKLVKIKAPYSTGGKTVAELNVLDGVTGLASQAEAEAGTNNTKLMTPLRLAQAIDALANPPDYESSQTSFVAAGTYTFTHSLGKLPSNVQVWIVCVSASEGFSVGDWYGPIGAETFADGANNGLAIAMNTTTIKTRLGAQSMPIINYSTGVRGITYSNWRLVVRAWK
jgi:hypothetical protein